MTCIVAVSQGGKIVMGGDSAATSMETGETVLLKIPKVFIREDYIIGYAGSIRFGKFIQYTFEIPRVPSWAVGSEKLDEFMNNYFIPELRQQISDNELDAKEKETFSLLVGIRGHIFEIDNEFAAYESSTYYAAIGSASAVATGALEMAYPIARPQGICDMALTIAAEKNAFCRPPFTILELEWSEE